MVEQGYCLCRVSSIIGKDQSTVAEILTLSRLPEENRDGYTSDPTICRALLLRIVRRKQTIAMFTTFDRYKKWSHENRVGERRQ
jgi:hypothetical protein